MTDITASNDTAVASFTTFLKTRDTIAMTVVVPVSAMGMVANLLALWIWLVYEGPFNPTVFLLKMLVVCEFFFDLTNILSSTKEALEAYEDRTGLYLPPFGLLRSLVHTFYQLCVNFTLMLLFVRWLVAHFPLHVQLVMTRRRLYVASVLLLLYSLAQVVCVDILGRRDPMNAFHIEASFSILNNLLPSFVVFFLNCHIVWKTITAKRDEPAGCLTALDHQSPPVDTSSRRERKGKCCLSPPRDHPLLRLKEGGHAMLELTIVVICIGITDSILYPVPLIMRSAAMLDLGNQKKRIDTRVMILHSLELLRSLMSCIHVFFYFIFVTRFRRTLLLIVCFWNWPRRRRARETAGNADHIDLCGCCGGGGLGCCNGGCAHNGSYTVTGANVRDETASEGSDNTFKQGQGIDSAWLRKNYGVSRSSGAEDAKERRQPHRHREEHCGCHTTSDSNVPDLERSERRGSTPNQAQTESTWPYKNHSFGRHSSDENPDERRQPLHRQELYGSSDSDVGSDGRRLRHKQTQIESTRPDEDRSFRRHSSGDTTSERRQPPQELHLGGSSSIGDSNVRDQTKSERRVFTPNQAQSDSAWLDENRSFSRCSGDAENVQEGRQELHCGSDSIVPDGKSGRQASTTTQKQIASTRPEMNFSLLSVESISQRRPSSRENETTSGRSDFRKEEETRSSSPGNKEKSRSLFHCGSERSSRRLRRPHLTKEKESSISRPINAVLEPCGSVTKTKSENGSSCFEAHVPVGISRSLPRRIIKTTSHTPSAPPRCRPLMKEQVDICETAV